MKSPSNVAQICGELETYLGCHRDFSIRQNSQATIFGSCPLSASCITGSILYILHSSLHADLLQTNSEDSRGKMTFKAVKY